MKEKPIARFKVSFKRLYLVVLAWDFSAFLLFVIADVAVRGVENINFSCALITILVAIIGMAVAAAALSALLVAYCKVSVYQDRIGGHDFWGFYREQKWSEAENVRPLNYLLGLKMAILQSRSNNIWLPMFLADMNRFRTLVSELSSPHSALAEYLTQNEQQEIDT
ncbi:hypothetical protein Pan153_22390 [Gimesia panareensis]|uniref:Uncharacterized protein n=1 Tax=Gimesia panareensis TaxID=2527978 RepID=A0A518FMJ4_9PLAN|nr:hypothetical protein [Gimesia panareensis]QDV17586.1 hypothetical protein Pan153_22390 [Gimesia panareensis]